MSTLHIDLQDGFAGDAVVILVDGVEVFRQSDVRTDLRISRAGGATVETGDRAVAVEVRARGASASQSVDPSRTPYVSVNLDPDGGLRLRASDQPFAYL